MTATLLSVSYRLRIPVTDFRNSAELAARRIAETPGLAWKIWGLDAETGEGTSIYLFRDAASAEDFASGPAIAQLRDGAAETVNLRLSAVDPVLSTITKGAVALAPAIPAAREAS
ncbi:MAG: YdhR family protein [Bauldia sp.]|nr:YdhR family protein [Bauldia sp.]